MEGKLSYTEAKGMTLDELMEFNSAIDSYIERKNRKSGDN